MIAFLLCLVASRLAGISGPRRLSRALLFSTLALGGPVLSLTVGHAEAPGEPSMIAAATADADADGFIDTVSVTFDTPMTETEPLSSTGPDSPGFRIVCPDSACPDGVGGYEIDSFRWLASTRLDVMLAETGAPDTGATPVVVYESGTGEDTAGAVSATGQEMADGSTQQASDAAGPVLMAFAANDQGEVHMFNAVGDEAFIVFSEPTTLVGNTKYERWSNLERALRFTSADPPEFNGCPTDGEGIAQVPSRHNFPEPGVDGPDVVLAPKAPQDNQQQPEFVTTFHVKLVEDGPGGNGKSASPFIAIPKGCWVGVEQPRVDPSTGAPMQPLLVDRAGNGAQHQEATGASKHRVRIVPAEAKLLAAETSDSNGDPDARLDGIRLTFDQRLDDATLAQRLSEVSITVDDLAARIDSMQTGAVPDDATVLIRFTPPEGAAWGTETTPRVSYSMPSGCEPLAANTAGVKTHVPAGVALPEYRACVGSFDVQAQDKAPPLLLGAHTVDADEDGVLDAIGVTFSEPVASSAGAGWTVADRTVTALAARAADPRRAEVRFAPGPAGDTGATPATGYATPAAGKTLDLAGNELVPVDGLIPADATPPRIRSAVLRDATGDGDIDRIDLAYSENLVGPGTGTAQGFRFGGLEAGGLEAEIAGDDRLTLTLEGVGGSGPRALAFTAGPTTRIADAAGNASGDQTVDAAETIDQARPRAVLTVSPGAPLRAGTATVRATFTEPMATSAPAVAMTGNDPVLSKQVVPLDDAGHVNGWSSAAPAVWEGTIEVLAEDCPHPRGCDVEVRIDDARDTAGNLQAQTETLRIEIDTIAPVAPTLGDARALLPAGEAAPPNTVNMLTDDLAVAVETSGDAGAGTATLLIDGNPVSPAATHGPMADGAGTVSVATAYEDNAALRQALPADAPHSLTVELCDDAGNCTPSSNAREVTADYTPVGVSMTVPAPKPVVSGGSSLRIEWDGDDDADFAHVDIDYSRNGGASYDAPIAHGLQAREGSFTWRVPTIDAAQASVRVAAVDAAGNRAYASLTQRFAIDSSVPAVSVTAPSSRSPFLPAGGTVTVGWRATDLTLDRVAGPIRIHYSTDDGRSWRNINGSAYSRTDDGREVWRVPNLRSFTARLRVLATDATGKTSAAISPRLAIGVAGYTVEKKGRIYGFGAADARTNESVVLRRGWVAGIAMRRDGKAGYVMSTRGNLYPFSIGSTRNAAKRVKLSLREGTARGVVLRTNTSGYVLDKYGRIHRFGGAPKARPSKTWSRSRARAIVLASNGRGGYVMDTYGRLHPFRVGRYAMPPRIQPKKVFGSRRAVAIVLESNERSGYVLDKYGRVYSFDRRRVRRVSSSGVGKYRYAKAIVRVTDTAGYWVDYRGTLRRWGSAFGDPTRARLWRARGAVGT